MSRAVIFDLDGTIYYGDELALYAQEVVSHLQSDGYEIIFFTNNSTKTRQEIFEKLISLGLDVSLNKIYTSAYASALYMASQGVKKVFLIGSEGFKQELYLQGVEIVSPLEAEVVLIGMDTTFTYETIAQALLAVENGAKIVASNVDKNFPVEGGILRPGCNAIVASLLGSCDAQLNFIVGKPNSYLLEIIVQDFNLNSKKICVVGDSLESDIAMADNYGCQSILVSYDGVNLHDVERIVKESF